MLKAKKGSSTHVALVTAVACLCLGLGFGLLWGPFCWHCLSSQRVVERVALAWAARSDLRKPLCLRLWICGNCGRAWESMTPWENVNGDADNYAY